MARFGKIEDPPLINTDSFELLSQVGCCRSLQGSCRWWLVIALVGRHLGQVAAMITSKWHKGSGGGAPRIAGYLQGAAPQNAGGPGAQPPRIVGGAAPPAKRN